MVTVALVVGSEVPVMARVDRDDDESGFALATEATTKAPASAAVMIRIARVGVRKSRRIRSIVGLLVWLARTWSTRSPMCIGIAEAS